MTEQELRKQLDQLSMGPRTITAAVAQTADAVLNYKPAPEKWCIREIVAHLADVEIIYGYRMRQMLADKSPTIAPIDQDDWARNLNYREAPLAASLEQYSTLRQANIRLLRQIEIQDLGKGAFHPERGRVITLAELFGMMVGHDPNHLRQIEALKEQARAAGAA